MVSDGDGDGVGVVAVATAVGVAVGSAGSAAVGVALDAGVAVAASTVADGTATDGTVGRGTSVVAVAVADGRAVGAEQPSVATRSSPPRTAWAVWRCIGHTSIRRRFGCRERLAAGAAQEASFAPISCRRLANGSVVAGAV